MRLLSPFAAFGCAILLGHPALAEGNKSKQLESQDKVENFEVQDLTSKKTAPKGKAQIQDLSTTKTQDKSSAPLH